MKIVTISFFDDNFGDMLIRICFERLLRVVLKNLGYDENACVIDNMHIKDVDEARLSDADLILFCGGAMFGFNSLGVFESLDAVTAAAEQRNIPVVFSSMGFNHMRTDPESAAQLNAVLRRKCVRAMSVRESAALFAPYTEDCGFTVESVCDPAVWTRYVYRRDIREVQEAKTDRVVGLNVVRGGLFKANFKDWSLKDEETYLSRLTELLDENGVSYRLFTNGSVLDCNGLLHIADRLEIPREKLILPDTTRELVRTIAGFDAVAAIRMHAGIISYALDIPSTNLVWNEKIPQFYQSIGYSERAVDPDSFADQTTEDTEVSSTALLAEHSFALIREMLSDSQYHADENYLMTLYRYLFTTLGAILHKSGECYPFQTVSHLMSLQESGADDDVTDYRTKLRRSRYCYQVLSERNLTMQYRNIRLQGYLRKLYSSPVYRAYHFVTGTLKMHEKLTYRLAELSDLNNVRELYQAAVAELQFRRIPQWDENYPTDDDFIPDIKGGKMQLVYKGTRLAGAFTLTDLPLDRFRHGAWRYPDESYLTLQRPVMHPDCTGFGVPKKALSHIISSLREQGVQNLRADISSANPYEQKLFRKAGFEKVGETQFNGAAVDLLELHL